MSTRPQLSEVPYINGESFLYRAAAKSCWYMVTLTTLVSWDSVEKIMKTESTCTKSGVIESDID